MAESNTSSRRGGAPDHRPASPQPGLTADDTPASDSARDDHDIELGQHRVSLAATRRAPDGFRTAFQRARAEVGHARCLCCPGRPRLVIRRRGGNRYWLACWPGGGADHDRNCRFFHDDSPAASGRHGYARSALDELGAGAARIRIVDALTAGPRTNHDQASGPTSSSTGQRRRMTLGGLLHYIWERAELNGLGPPHWDRDWAGCARAVHGVLDTIMVNGEPLAGALWVVPAYRKATAKVHRALFDRFAAKLTRTRTSARRGLLLGAIKDVSPSRHGQRIRLRHHPVPLYLTTELLDRLTRSTRHAFSERRPAGSERVLLALIEKSPGGYHTIVAATVMLTTRTFIPADSSFEVQMADALTDAHRPFVKPLRYDSSDLTLPDFVVLDTEPPTIVEVWGRPGHHDYERRRHEKRRIYGAERGDIDPDPNALRPPLLEWDVRNPLPCIDRPLDTESPADDPR